MLILAVVYTFAAAAHLVGWSQSAGHYALASRTTIDVYNVKVSCFSTIKMNDYI